MGRNPSVSKTNSVSAPGELEGEICSSIQKILQRIGGGKGKDDRDKAEVEAEVEAAYYTAYILLTPIDLKKTISDEIVRGYARKLIRRGNFNLFKKAKENLLEDGLIAQIVPTLDFKDAKGFGKAAYLPIDPKIFFELNKDKLVDIQPDTLEVIKNRTTTLSEEFNKKFSIKALRERCSKSVEAKKRNFTLDKFEKKLDINVEREECRRPTEAEMSNITLYYSGMWVTYTLAANIQNNCINNIYMMINGSRVSGSPQFSYYSKILSKNIKINMIFTLNEEFEKLSSTVRSIHFPNDSNIIIKHISNEGYMTCRITIFDREFALDGRKLIHLERSEPSYTGTLYLTDKCMEDIKGIFEAVWTESRTVFPQA